MLKNWQFSAQSVCKGPNNATFQTAPSANPDGGPGVEPSKWTGTKSRTGSIRGHSRLVEKRPNWQVTKRSLFGLAFFEVTSNRGHCYLFGLMKSRFSYQSFIRVTSIRPRALTDLITSMSLRPRATSIRGRSILRPRIRPLLDPA